MNLIESIVALSILGGASGGATWALLEGMRPLFVLAAALAGGLGVPVALGVVVGAVGFIDARLRGSPYWPACTACGGAEFKLEFSSGATLARCPCGRQYVRHGRQCRRVLAGGASRAHLRWRSLRGWIDDQDASSADRVDPPYRGSEPD